MMEENDSKCEGIDVAIKKFDSGPWTQRDSSLGTRPRLVSWTRIRGVIGADEEETEVVKAWKW